MKNAWYQESLGKIFFKIIALPGISEKVCKSFPPLSPRPLSVKFPSPLLCPYSGKEILLVVPRPGKGKISCTCDPYTLILYA